MTLREMIDAMREMAEEDPSTLDVPVKFQLSWWFTEPTGIEDGQGTYGERAIVVSTTYDGD